MKKSMKMFGIVCAASLALTVACSNGDDAPAGSARTTYTVGDIVSFEGGRYLVTKNTESAARSAARAATNSDSGLYYQNENAAKYRERQLAELSNGITQYVELFDITTKKEGNDSDTASLNDKYLILQNDVKIYLNDAIVVVNNPVSWSVGLATSGTIQCPDRRLPTRKL